MTTILWIGLTSTPEIFEQLLKKGYFHAPTYVAQKNIIKGIEESTGNIIHSINGFMMNTYPKCPELITKKMRWSHREGAEDISVSSLNIPYLDFLVRNHLMVLEGKKWAKKHMNDEKIQLIVYAASQPYIETALAIKKIIPKANICLIMPDLPLYMELGGSKLKRTIKLAMWGKLKRLIYSCDNYIFFTKYMADYLKLKNRRWMIMEGSVDLSEIENTISESTSSNQIIVMYSGAIDMKYGIPELLNAFHKIDSSRYQLWLTGKGNAESLVHEIEKIDDRIKFWGFLSSRKEMLALQKKATMFVNTRMPTEVASAYCFPSKIFDYLLSGKPVLSFKIPGIPDEYFDYLIEIKSISIDSIKDSIIRIGNMTESERQYIGNLGKEFILREKNCIKQGMRICKFLNIEPLI